MKNIFINKLPDQYYFVDKSSIKPEEIIELQLSVGWGRDSLECWQSCIDNSIATIGVRDSNDKLVGAAFLAGNLRHAVICDLTVNPDHQFKGIGGAIMFKIMDKISEMDIPFIYTELVETNPFREKILQSGFKVTGGSLFMDVFEAN